MTRGKIAPPLAIIPVLTYYLPHGSCAGDSDFA